MTVAKAPAKATTPRRTRPTRPSSSAEERAKFAAEARKADAEAGAAEALMVKTYAEADAALIELEREQRKERAELAKDEYNHVYVVKDAVSSTSVAACMAQLRFWMRTDPKCKIEICFNSPGGSVIDGMALWDYIQQVRAAGHFVTTSTIGYAASVAGILLQAGDRRVMGREAYLLVHEIAFGAGGKLGEVEDEVVFVKKIQKRVLDIFVARSQASGCPKPLTERKFRESWQRRDWWLDSAEALQMGLVDEVR